MKNVHLEEQKPAINDNSEQKLAEEETNNSKQSIIQKDIEKNDGEKAPTKTDQDEHHHATTQHHPIDQN